MSLILESLQRAEEERKGGSVPDSEAMYEAPEPERKSRRWMIWAGVGLAVGVVSSVVVFRGISEKDTRVDSPPKPPQRASGEGRELAPPTVSFPASGDIQPDDAGKGSQDPPSTRSSIRPAPSLAEKTKTPAERPKLPVLIPPPVSRPRPPGDTAGPSDSAKSTEEKDPRGSFKSAAGVPSDSSSPPSEARISKTAPAVSKPSANKKSRSDKIPLLRELPAEIQARFKDLNLNVVVHEKNPAESLVFINLGQYREGDRIGGSGLRVERILPDAVVLDYGQGRFKLKMYQ